MKKAFTITLTFISLMLSLSIISFAATHSATFDLDLSEDYDFTESVLIMKYNTGGWFSRAKASTTVSTTIEETGFVYVHVTDADGLMTDSRIDFGTGNSFVNTGEVSISANVDEFIRILHYAKKTDPDITRDWEYFVR